MSPQVGLSSFYRSRQFFFTTEGTGSPSSFHDSVETKEHASHYKLDLEALDPVFKETFIHQSTACTSVSTSSPVPVTAKERSPLSKALKISGSTSITESTRTQRVLEIKMACRIRDSVDRVTCSKRIKTILNFNYTPPQSLRSYAFFHVYGFYSNDMYYARLAMHPRT